MFTRKEFLQTISAVAASALVPAVPAQSSAAPEGAHGRVYPPKRGQIGRGVTFYSFQDEVTLRKMDLEDCFATVADLGADGVEIISEMTLPDYPNVSAQFIDHWNHLMEKYSTKPVCYDAMYDSNIRYDRDMIMKESVASLARDMRIAKQLGFRTIRAQRTVPPDVIEKTIPVAEQLDVMLSIEVHPPLKLKSEWMDSFMAVIDRTKSKHFGFTLDCGLFAKRPPRVQRDWYIRHGAQESVAKYVETAYENGQTKEETAAEVKKMGGNSMDLDWAQSAYNYSYNDPKLILDFAEHIVHSHAKFYEMTDDFREYSIPYEEVIPVLLQSGYSGHMSSEYEGQRHINDIVDSDAPDQLRRHHLMLKRLIGEA